MQLVRVLINAVNHETAVQDVETGDVLPLDVMEIITVLKPMATDVSEGGCVHKWIEVTTVSQDDEHYICAKCPASKTETRSFA